LNSVFGGVHYAGIFELVAMAKKKKLCIMLEGQNEGHTARY